MTHVGQQCYTRDIGAQGAGDCENTVSKKKTNNLCLFKVICFFLQQQITMKPAFGEGFCFFPTTQQANLGQNEAPKSSTTCVAFKNHDACCIDRLMELIHRKMEPILNLHP